jgi:alpha-L-fucosidase
MTWDRAFPIDRRALLAAGAAVAVATKAPAAASSSVVALAARFEIPTWFRDAKFGIWAHWGPQCVPEFGDWYGRLMYVQGSPVYAHHVRTYGHPSRSGFIDLIGKWKAEEWDPAALMQRYVRAGARYFVSMANHHDNFDNFDSRHHPWNAVRVGPRRDIVGTWARHTREAGLRFGVSNHSSHAWHWWQTAYGYDAEGPMKGVRYDAFRLRAKDGAGSWWDGLDPQLLYTGPSFVPPDGIDSIAAMEAWHGERDGQWLEDLMPGNHAFAANWLQRQQDLVERYDPDLVYFDDTGLPFGEIGIAAVSHFYARSLKSKGRLDVVMNAKKLSHELRAFLVEDVERGFVADIQAQPWQTDTCIGNWHYDRNLFERHGYKSAKAVVQRLCDVVSKNGNLLLSIPLRGSGAIDADEEAILDDLARWFSANGAAIYGTRPWRRFGEGPTRPPAGVMNEQAAKPYVAEDIRFTAGDAVLNAFFLEWPSGAGAIRSLGRAAVRDARIEAVRFSDGTALRFEQRDDVLIVHLPAPAPGSIVPAISVHGRGLV